MFHNPFNVNLVCSFISHNATPIAFTNGNLIGSNSYHTLSPNDTHNTHESSGHEIVIDSCEPLRDTTIKNDFPIYVCNTAGNVFASTAFPSTDNIVSFFCNPALAHNKSEAKSFTSAAAGFTSPDKNHSACKNFSVGNK
jgi:hypothetical protein